MEGEVWREMRGGRGVEGEVWRCGGSRRRCVEGELLEIYPRDPQSMYPRVPHWWVEVVGFSWLILRWPGQALASDGQFKRTKGA